MASRHSSSIFFQSEARCGKAVCQSIDFPEFFAPARPHLFSGHYVGVPCNVCGENVTGGVAEYRAGSIPGTDNAPQQLLTRPFYCLYSVLSAFSGAAHNIHDNTIYTTAEYTRQHNDPIYNTIYITIHTTAQYTRQYH